MSARIIHMCYFSSMASSSTSAARSRKHEEEKATLDIVMGALEQANRSLVETCSQLDELHLQLKKSNRQ
jgi:hypothetical protein